MHAPDASIRSFAQFFDKSDPMMYTLANAPLISLAGVASGETIR